LQRPVQGAHPRREQRACHAAFAVRRRAPVPPRQRFAWWSVSSSGARRRGPPTCRGMKPGPFLQPFGVVFDEAAAVYAFKATRPASPATRVGGSGSGRSWSGLPRPRGFPSSVQTTWRRSGSAAGDGACATGGSAGCG